MDVFCDYCGAKLDVEHENCCTHCGAPFDNNASVKEYREEKKRKEEEYRRRQEMRQNEYNASQQPSQSNVSSFSECLRTEDSKDDYDCNYNNDLCAYGNRYHYFYIRRNFLNDR